MDAYVLVAALSQVSVILAVGGILLWGTGEKKGGREELDVITCLTTNYSLEERRKNGKHQRD